MTPNRAARRRKARQLRRLGIASLAVAGTLPFLPGGTAEAGASGEARPPMADPDTYIAPDGYYTYGTTLTGKDACGNTLWNTYYVPVIKTTSRSLAGACINRDAMPSGAGGWAAPGSHIWAPSISYFNSTYFLHYSAQKPGGQWCIGRATASSPLGPFTNQQEFACPGAGRWAIDPDVYVGTEGNFLTYRDDAITSGAETGISSVQLNASGHAIWSTRKDLLKSTDVGWDHAASTGVNVVENPSLVKVNSTFYLMFSGNDWNSNKYSVGMASCGSSALPASRCKPLVDVNRPYFGYSGSGLNPVRQLPGNHPGPGGMASTTSYKGTTTDVTWHWWAGNNDRRIKSGSLNLDSSGYFNVTL